MSFTLGYNTNGFPHHRLVDAVKILAEMGYRSVAITLDQYSLNPNGSDLALHEESIIRLLDHYKITCVIETGARFILDRLRKHQPTLLDADFEARSIRRNFIKGAIYIASRIGSPAVSFWSGSRPSGVTVEKAWEYLTDECRQLLQVADVRNVNLAFEPEPGMFIETMDQYRELRDRLSHPHFGLTLDVGHVHCLGDGNPADRIREFAGDLRNIHIEDMRRGVHEHLMFGDGEMDFPPIFAALREINYEGGVYVELSRHGHDAVNAAKQSFDFLSKL